MMLLQSSFLCLKRFSSTQEHWAIDVYVSVGAYAIFTSLKSTLNSCENGTLNVQGARDTSGILGSSRAR
jgi:hypothetical protein